MEKLHLLEIDFLKYKAHNGLIDNFVIYNKLGSNIIHQLKKHFIDPDKHHYTDFNTFQTNYITISQQPTNSQPTNSQLKCKSTNSQLKCKSTNSQLKCKSTNSQLKCKSTNSQLKCKSTNRQSTNRQLISCKSNTSTQDIKHLFVVLSILWSGFDIICSASKLDQYYNLINFIYYTCPIVYFIIATGGMLFNLPDTQFIKEYNITARSYGMTIFGITHLARIPIEIVTLHRQTLNK
jgi:hypothetical protein